MDEWFEQELEEAIRNPWGNAMGRAYAKAAREELNRRQAAWDALFARVAESNNNGSP